MKRPRILIADEDPQSTNHFADYMTSAEYDLLFANDSVSALLALREEQPDLVLINVALTDRAGEIIRFVRHTSQVSATGIIVFGPDESPEERSILLDAGADHCLPLSASKSDILAHVRAVLRRIDRLHQQHPQRIDSHP